MRSGECRVREELSPGRSGHVQGRQVRAAQYVRMSTEHQKYSTENQGEAIERYAAARGIEIVKTYADQGKSGLSLDGRDALKQLIDDVQANKADFSTILVYDVSRCCRFQDRRLPVAPCSVSPILRVGTKIISLPPAGRARTRPTSATRSKE